MILHEDPALAIHAVPRATESSLAALIDEFAPDPDRAPVEGELPLDQLAAALPPGFLALQEWCLP